MKKEAEHLRKRPTEYDAPRREDETRTAPSTVAGQVKGTASKKYQEVKEKASDAIDTARAEVRATAAEVYIQC